MKKPFDGEYFASVYWQIFLRLTFFLVLVLCLLKVGMGVYDNGWASLATRSNIRDVINIVISAAFFALILWEKTKYEEKIHNLCLVVFFLVNVVFYYI